MVYCYKIFGVVEEFCIVVGVVVCCIVEGEVVCMVVVVGDIV